MVISEIGSLIVLALIDSTSIGTLVVPLILLLATQLNVSRYLLYLATISLFYFAVGIALLIGANTLQRWWADTFDAQPVRIAQLILGVGLFAASWFVGRPKRSRGKSDNTRSTASRWEERLAGATGTAALVGIALLAGVSELATMVPYLAAIGILTGSDLQFPAQAGLLGGYVAVMATPALALLVARLVAGKRTRAGLARARDWVVRQTSELLPWILGIVGVLIAYDALTHLDVAATITNSIAQ